MKGLGVVAITKNIGVNKITDDFINCELLVWFQKLSSLHDQGMELCDYKPHPYNNEGEPGDPAELDSISLADSQFSLGELENLDSKFHQLAELCRPDLIQQSYMSQASFSSHHYQHHHHHHSHHHL